MEEQGKPAPTPLAAYWLLAPDVEAMWGKLLTWAARGKPDVGSV